MNDSIATLLRISSPSLLNADESVDVEFLKPFGAIGDELARLLRERNGFFAFESALHVFPIGQCAVINLKSWNEVATWKHEYGDLLPASALFFAQDAHGNQFGIVGGSVVLMDSESASLVTVAPSIAEWARVLLADWRGWTGFELCHSWQMANRPIMEGERIVPKVPFILGGKREVGCLYAGSILEVMGFRGSIARQIADLPDGTRVCLRIVHSAGEKKTDAPADV